MKFAVPAFSLLIAAGLLNAPVAAEILYDWSFDDAAGTSLTDAAQSGFRDGTWDEAFDRSFTQGDGTFRIRRPVGGPANAFVALDPPLTGKAWLVVESSGWQLRGRVANEVLRIGFVERKHDERPQVTAQIRIERSDENEVSIGGDAFVTANGATLIDDQALLTATQRDPVTLVLEVDLDENTYAIHYKVGAAPFVELGTGSIDPNRGARYLRWGAAGGFSSTAGEHFDIQRLYVTTTDPM